MNDTHSPVVCLVTIVDRGKGCRVTDVLRIAGVAVQLVLLGQGTASTEMMDCLGLDGPEKDVVISLARGPRTAVLLDRLTLELNLTRPGRGIAFALPLTGITAAANRQIQSATVSVEMQNNREVPAMAESIRYELIVSIIEHGTADEIMAAAKTAGATGGTVLKARGLRAAEVEKFLNITIQPEKDLVLILARADQRQGIMKAISAEIQNHTAEHGIAFSMPATDVVGLNPEAWLRDSRD